MNHFSRFKHNFLENRFYLSRYKSAAFSAGVVALCIAISYYYEMGLATAVFIIGAQSVTGINRQGAFRIRLSIAIKTAFILSLSALLAVVASMSGLAVTLVAVVVLAFSFAWWRQLFPFNWPDIIIPTGVLFFMNYLHNALIYVVFGALVGVVCEFLLGVIISIKRSREQAEIPKAEAEFIPPTEKPDKLIFGLKEYLVLYGTQLSILLIIGFLMMHYTPFPHAYWMPLTAIIVFKVGRRATFKRVVERTLGTLAGCALGSLLLYFHLNAFWLSVSSVICIFIWLCYVRYHYAVGTIFITTFLFIMLSKNDLFSFYVIAERMVFTVVGGMLALLISLVFLKKERY